jgi:Family of unknown function (DUF6929)
MIIRSARDARLKATLSNVRPLPRVHAGSALMRWGDRLLAVQDDAYELAWITLREGEEPRIDIVACTERLGPLPKSEKPDFEAAVVHASAIYVIGSGSARTRRRLVRLVPNPFELALRDAGALIDCVAVALGRALGRSAALPNVEGALGRAGALTLFHRGARDTPNVAVTLNAGALDGETPIVTETAILDLGEVNGVPLALTDVAPIDGGYLYLACAEDTPDAISDGPIVGAAVGIIRAGEGSFALLVEGDLAPTLRKCEGIALDADARGAFILTDPDDPARPAELCRVVFEGPW